MIRSIVASPSKTLALWCMAVVLGAAAHALDERVLFRQDHVLLLSGGALATGILGFGARPGIRLAMVALACMLAAFLRYDVVLLSRIRAVDLAPPEETMTFVGMLASAPAERSDRTVLAFRDVRDEGGRAYPGEVRVTVAVGIAETPVYGDIVRWTCAPRRTDRTDGGFGAYLFSRGVPWSCRSYALETVGKAPTNLVRRSVHRFRAVVFRAATEAFPEPDASMVLGLLIGAEEGLPPSLSDAFRASGTSHILAVSGYNVVQLVRLLTLAFGLAGLGRRAAAVLSGGGVALFAMLVGDDASVVRAAVMGCVMTLAAMLGRRYSGSIALPLAAAAMLLMEPLALRHDVGFLLSFCAVLGLHVFAPPIQELVGKVMPWKSVSSIVSETTAATVATLPVILATFGRVPLIALPANTVILPVIPVIMALGALALIAASLSALLAFPLIATTSVLLRFVIESATIAAALPVPAIEAQVGPAGASTLAVSLIGLMCALHLRSKRRGTPPYAPL